MPLFDDFLAQLLSARLEILAQARMVHPPGTVNEESIVPTARLILWREGAVEYRIEGQVEMIAAPAILFIPAWIHRAWREPLGREIESWYCEFQVHPAPATNVGALFCPSCDVELETSAFERLDTALKPSSPRPLVAEAELKGMLARFLNAAQPLHQGTPTGLSPAENQLQQAISWLHIHHDYPDAIEQLLKRTDLSPNHFRLIFRRKFGCSPRQYLTRLRMERARHLLIRSNHLIKQIAAMVGYHDPLYFSRHYRLYWDRTPQEERKGHPDAETLDR